MRPAIIVGNWKMHKTIGEALQFINEFVRLLAGARRQVYLAVPHTSLAAVAELACGIDGLQVGAQDVSAHQDGAWTGEVSARMIKEAGAYFVLIGHSERRLHHAEGNDRVNQKLKLAMQATIQPIVCVGETFTDREEGREKEVLEKQLTESLAGLSKEDASCLMIAYEPVWAIGTGKNATPEIAQSTHSFCRQVLEKIWDEQTAQKVPLLYGGSVKPENAEMLLMQPDIDGLLVGGASLNARTFSQIVNANVNHQVA